MTTTIHLTADNFNGSPDFFNHRDPLPENLRGMKAAKAAMGLTGTRGETCAFGDGYEFRPYRSCTILFVTFDDSEGE